MITKTELKETVTMESGSHNFDLIRGNFTPEDAQEIINHLITTKINFHEMRNFSHEIRFGKKVETSVKRIAELKDAKLAVKELLLLASEENKTLRIKSSVTIELI